MDYLDNDSKVKSYTTLDQYNGANTTSFISQNILYCDNCRTIIKKNPILCYIFINYYCNEKCHIQKHEKFLNDYMMV